MTTGNNNLQIQPAPFHPYSSAATVALDLFVGTFGHGSKT